MCCSMWAENPSQPMSCNQLPIWSCCSPWLSSHCSLGHLVFISSSKETACYSCTLYDFSVGLNECLFWRFFIAFTFTTMVFLLTGESAFYGGSVAANSDFSLLAALCLQSGTVALLGCFPWFLWNKAFPRNPLLPLWVGMESLRNSKALMLTPGYHLFPRLGIRAAANRAPGSFPAPRKRCSRGNWNSVAKKKRHFTVNL